MKRFLAYSGIFVIGAGFGIYLLLTQYPSIVYQVVKHGIPVSENEFFFPELPTAESRLVVKPNPDFLYATCFYDLSHGPVQLEGLMPDSSYWSVALYRPNTVNFYVASDRELSDSLSLLILPTEEGLQARSSPTRLYSPEKKGFVLFRILVSDPSPETMERMIRYQKSLTAKVIESDTFLYIGT